MCYHEQMIVTTHFGDHFGEFLFSVCDRHVFVKSSSYST